MSKYLSYLATNLTLQCSKPLYSISLWCWTGDSPLVLLVAATRNKKQSASVSEFLKLLIQKLSPQENRYYSNSELYHPLLIRPTVSSPRELLTYLKSRSGNNSPSWDHSGVFQCFKLSSHFVNGISHKTKIFHCQIVQVDGLINFISIIPNPKHT